MRKVAVSVAPRSAKMVRRTSKTRAVSISCPTPRRKVVGMGTKIHRMAMAVGGIDLNLPPRKRMRD